MSLEDNLRVAPVQPRAKARLDSIHAAARTHFEEVGRDRFNLDGVAAYAGCSVATIYRYYKDRVALLDAVMPDRDQAGLRLDAIRNLRNMDASLSEKWLAVEHILDQA